MIWRWGVGALTISAEDRQLTLVSVSMPLPEALVFVDLETTGARPEVDRITEIGIVEIRDGQVQSWSTLVNPETDIPPFIQKLTGITPDMVASAPTFDLVADEVLARLKGRLFVAHNVRFDYSFLRAALKRAGLEFHAPTLCTVKLSRKLFPAFHKHNLDSLVERHGFLVEGGRHRALADADVLRQFWQRVQQEIPNETLTTVVASLLAPPAVPPNLDPAQLDDLPDGPGVFLFLGQDGAPLYIGRDIKLRKKVLSLFEGKQKRNNTLLPLVHRLDWHETAGDLGAALLETRLLRRHHPVFNRGATVGDEAECYSWQLPLAGDSVPQLVPLADWDAQERALLFGLFASPREAKAMLTRLAKTHKLCAGLLGLDARAGACSDPSDCRGACIGKESSSFHSARLLAALAKYKLTHWPWPGPIGLVEKDGWTGRRDVHVLDRWRWLGSVQHEADIPPLLEQPCPWSAAEYRLLEKAVRHGGFEILRLY